MILLCSDGLSSPALLEAVDAVLPPDFQKAALVVTADKQYKFRSHNIPRNRHELEQLGLEVDVLDIDRCDPELLLDYDVVEFIGGNPFYLLRSIRRKNAEWVMEKLAEEKLLIGWSAGALVLGPTLELIHRYTPEMNRKGWVKSMDALNLCPFPILPHYSSFIHRFERLEERCQEFEEEYSIEVLRLNDGDGVFLNGDWMEVIRA